MPNKPATMDYFPGHYIPPVTGQVGTLVARPEYSLADALVVCGMVDYRTRAKLLIRRGLARIEERDGELLIVFGDQRCRLKISPLAGLWA